MKYEYKTNGICALKIDFEVENNKLKNVVYHGGCNGNLKGISNLLEGMDIDDVIKRLDGVTCGLKKTSCPDQLSKALQLYKNENL